MRSLNAVWLVFKRFCLLEREKKIALFNRFPECSLDFPFTRSPPTSFSCRSFLAGQTQRPATASESTRRRYQVVENVLGEKVAMQAESPKPGAAAFPKARPAAVRTRAVPATFWRLTALSWVLLDPLSPSFFVLYHRVLRGFLMPLRLLLG